MNRRLKDFKLIFICENDLSQPIGGTFHVKELLEALSKRIEGLLLIAPKYGKDSKLILPTNTKTKVIYSPSIPILKWLYFYCISTLYIISLRLKSNKKIVVYSREMPLNVLLTFICKALSIPMLIEVNGFLLEEIKSSNRSLVEYLATSIAEKINFSLCNKIIIVSSTLKEEICRTFKIKDKKAEVVYNGIRIIPKASSANRAQLERYFDIPNPIIAGFVGSCYPYHDILLLIDSAPEILKISDRIRFLIAGDGEMLNTWKERVKNKRLIRIFHFPGYIQKEMVPSLISAFDICLSLRVKNVKGPGMKIIEYLLYNKPVIATSNQETRVLFSDFKNICWVQPGNKKSLINAFRKVLSNPESFNDPTSHQKIIKRFTWDHTASSILSIIENIVKTTDSINHKKCAE